MPYLDSRKLSRNTNPLGTISNTVGQPQVYNSFDHTFNTGSTFQDQHQPIRSVSNLISIAENDKDDQQVSN